MFRGERAAVALDRADPLLELFLAGQVLGFGEVVVPDVDGHGVAPLHDAFLVVVIIA